MTINDNGLIAFAELEREGSFADFRAGSASIISLFGSGLRTAARVSSNGDPWSARIEGFERGPVSLSEVDAAAFIGWSSLSGQTSLRRAVFRESGGDVQKLIEDFPVFGAPRNLFGFSKVSHAANEMVAFEARESVAPTSAATLFFKTVIGIAGVGSDTVLIREGDIAPGTTLTAFDSFISIAAPMSEGGELAFASTVDSQPFGFTVSRNHDSAIFRADSLGVRRFLSEFSDAPELPDMVFSGINEPETGGSAFDTPLLNAAGDMTFRATARFPYGDLTPVERGLWVYPINGDPYLVARVGGPAPGGAAGERRFTRIDRPVINSRGEVAFVGRTDDFRESLFTNGGGSLRAVVSTGTDLPGSSGVDIADIGPASLNSAGDMVFAVRDTLGLGAIVAYSGVLDEAFTLAHELEPIDVFPGDALESLRLPAPFTIYPEDGFGSIAGPSGSEDGVPSSLNERGEIVFSLAFEDGSSGVFFARLPGLSGANPADISPAGGDGRVDVFDLIAFLGAFNPAEPKRLADIEPDPFGDRDNDVFDLIWFLEAFAD